LRRGVAFDSTTSATLVRQGRRAQDLDGDGGLDLTKDAYDRVGAMVFDDHLRALVPAQRGRGALQALRAALIPVQPSLELLAITFDSFDEPPQWARQHAWPLVSAALAEIRTQAAGGSYGFGMLDIANLAISVLQYRQRDHKAWAELVAFLLDPRVGMSAKARALERLGRRETRVPQQARAQLRNGLATMSAFVDELGSPPESFVAGKLRLASRIGGLSRDEILVTLLELAGEANAVSRMLAASVLSSVQTRVGAGVASTIALMLAHDANHDVRGAAARALAQLTGTGQETLEEARHERLRTLLAESGVVVPYGALAGLYDAASANEATDDSLLLPVQLIATQHPSRTVRVGAQTLIALLDRTATSAKPRQPRPLPRASSRGKS